LSAWVDYVFEEGIDRIGRAGFEMKKEICQTLRGIAGLTLYAAVSESLPIVSFRLNGQDPRETGFMLQEGFGIQTRSGLHCAPLIHSAIGSHPAGTVRVSCSYLTDRGDLSAFFDAVRKIAAATGRRHHATD